MAWDRVKPGKSVHVDTLLAKPGIGACSIGGGYLLDLAAALKAHDPSYRAVHDGDRTEAFKRTMARTAIFLRARRRPELTPLF